MSGSVECIVSFELHDTSNFLPFTAYKIALLFRIPVLGTESESGVSLSSLAMTSAISLLAKIYTFVFLKTIFSQNSLPTPPENRRLSQIPRLVQRSMSLLMAQSIER
ncbi:hypothetical protein RRG08_040180 [Elysia crispata]|uniref:Uncharacterized protein n=1 Tax=Elysia crispata TaxID=231223 RepID=A0AAE0XWK5_9GAST|nr:hypothetical protein RRG08_040180 [Elysia crispata]